MPNDPQLQPTASVYRRMSAHGPRDGATTHAAAAAQHSMAASASASGEEFIHAHHTCTLMVWTFGETRTMIVM